MISLTATVTSALTKHGTRALECLHEELTSASHAAEWMRLAMFHPDHYRSRDEFQAKQRQKMEKAYIMLPDDAAPLSHQIAESVQQSTRKYPLGDLRNEPRDVLRNAYKAQVQEYNVPQILLRDPETMGANCYVGDDPESTMRTVLFNIITMRDYEETTSRLFPSKSAYLSKCTEVLLWVSQHNKLETVLRGMVTAFQHVLATEESPDYRMPPRDAHIVFRIAILNGYLDTLQDSDYDETLPWEWQEVLVLNSLVERITSPELMSWLFRNYRIAYTAVMEGV